MRIIFLSKSSPKKMNQQYSSTTANVGFAAYFLPLVSYSPLFFCTSPGYINSLSLSGLFPAMQLPDKEYMVKFLPLPIPYAQTSVCPRSTNVICLPRFYPFHEEVCRYTGNNTNQTSCSLTWGIPVEQLP